MEGKGMLHWTVPACVAMAAVALPGPGPQGSARAGGHEPAARAAGEPARVGLDFHPDVRAFSPVGTAAAAGSAGRGGDPLPDGCVRYDPIGGPKGPLPFSPEDRWETIERWRAIGDFIDYTRKIWENLPPPIRGQAILWAAEAAPLIAAALGGAALGYLVGDSWL